MSRPLFLLLAAALAAGTMAIGTASAAAIGPAPAVQPQGGIVLVESEWNGSHWRGNDWGDDRRSQHRHRHHDRRDNGPGFSFSFGAPGVYFGVAPRRDCYTTWDGRRYCRGYY